MRVSILFKHYTRICLIYLYIDDFSMSDGEIKKRICYFSPLPLILFGCLLIMAPVWLLGTDMLWVLFLGRAATVTDRDTATEQPPGADVLTVFCDARNLQRENRPTQTDVLHDQCKLQ